MGKEPKTRIVELSDTEYVPQVWRRYFLFGGEWMGLARTKDGLYVYSSARIILDRCVVATLEEAQSIIDEYFTREKFKRKLTQ